MSLRHFTACVLILALALLPQLFGQEKADQPKEPTAANQAIQALVEFDTVDTIHSENLVDLSNAAFALSHVLVASNGLGVEVAPVEAALRAQLGLEDEVGLVVTGVPDESAGAKAGLKQHDIITAVGESKITSGEVFQQALTAADGKLVKVSILRMGKEQTLEATPEKATLAYLDEAAARFTVEFAWPDERYRIGVTLAEADDTLRAQLKLAAGEGLVVTEVVPETPAAKAGLKPHDVLVKLDGKRLTTVEAINTQIQEIKDRSVPLEFLRGGKEMSLELAPQKNQEAVLEYQPLTVWKAEVCQRCHVDPHAEMAKNYGFSKSVWTDGTIAKYYDHIRAHTDKLIESELSKTSAKDDITGLRTQLLEMHKALDTLEAKLIDAATKDEAAPETNKDSEDGKKE